MAAGVVDVENFADQLENYLILCAKGNLKNDLSFAKAWLLTAKVLYPRKFGVQFLAYQIEKTTGNLKDSAKCFAELLANFPTEKELCCEVRAMTTLLRDYEEHIVPLDTADYLVRLFYQLPEPVQRGLLLNCANNTPDALDRCKLMLQLFKKFPNDIPHFAPNVMENLMTAEMRSPLCASPVNCYRKLLVCELIPLLAQKTVDCIELPPQKLLLLLDKCVEYYVTCAFEGSNRRRSRDDRETAGVEDPWTRLWESIELIGAKLKWGLAAGFTRYWTRDGFFKAISHFQMQRPVDGSHLQIAFCALVVLLRCVHEYLPIVEPTNPEQGFILVESFVQPESTLSEASRKIQKTDDDVTTPLLSAGQGAPAQLVPAFLAAVKCLETCHSNEIVRREYLRLRDYWKADQWLHTFTMDAIIYQGAYEQQIMLQSRRSEDARTTVLVTELSRVTWYYRVLDVSNLVDTIANIAGLLATMPAHTQTSATANILTVSTKKLRHVHFLPITRTNILQYCVKVLLQVLKKKTSDAALGHMLVLMQLNWPLESDTLNEISELITMRGGFGYGLFANYVINVDIIERFAYLAGPNGPKLPLDIFAGTQIHSQRRMSTRGVDKGAKEDFKSAIRAQVARWNEPIDGIIISFLKCERDLIKHSLLT